MSELIKDPLLDSTLAFTRSQGEMSSLIRDKDWSKHPLGEPAQWPQNLKSTLDLILANQFPMFVWWGSELYCFYNDAYRPSLGNDGKHPYILGEPAQQAWPEIWSVIEPLIQRVMKHGESIWHEDRLIPINRNGRLEDVYWTFSYSPLHNDEGEISGVLVTCVETSEKMVALQALRERERQLTRVIVQAPAAMAILTGPDHVIEIANDKALELWGHTAAEVLHKPLLEGMPELEGQGIVELLNDVYRTGVAFVANERPISFPRNGTLVPIYISFVYDAIRTADGTIEGVLAMGVDVTASVQARQKAEAGEAQFRLLANSMPQFVWTADAQGMTNYLNPALAHYTGLSTEELESEGWLQIVHPDDRNANIDAWSDSMKSGKDFLFEHRFLADDGSYRWQLSRAVPVRDGEGNISMWVGTSTDIHDIKEQEEDRDYFISMVSHELRTPLSTLKGYLELLKEKYGDGPIPTMGDALNVMDRQVTSLTGIIADLLDQTKIKTGNLDLKLETTDLNELVRTVIAEFCLVNATHTVPFAPGGPARVLADKSRMAQVIQNLLANAVKYAPHSKKILVKSIVTDKDVTILITDKGIGISTADQQKLFRRFYRVEGHDQKTFSGFGIGLYLVADIVKHHNGSVGIESEPGTGSTFCFTLPLL